MDRSSFVVLQSVHPYLKQLLLQLGSGVMAGKGRAGGEQV